MTYLILTDCFYPENKSASRHIYDLAFELSLQNKKVTIFCPSHNKKIREEKKFKIVRIKLFDAKKINYFLRGFSELIMPFKYLQKIFKTIDHVDKIIIYSPSIFFGLIIKILKIKFNCKVILLARDIFPDWAKQIGIFKNLSPFYFFLKFISNLQYKHSDVICLQSKKDYKIINEFYKFNTKKIILYNWIKKKNKYSNVSRVSRIKKFVFGGTVGPVQNWENIEYSINKINLLNKYIKFYIIGDGSWKHKLQQSLKKNNNVIFIKTLNEKNFLKFITKCDAGIISLNKKILFDNFPGKFFSYMEAGLPIIADINDTHELTYILNKYQIGFQNDPSDKEKLVKNILLLSKLNNLFYKKKVIKIYKKLIKDKFSSKKACDTIISI